MPTRPAVFFHASRVPRDARLKTTPSNDHRCGSIFAEGQELLWWRLRNQNRRFSFKSRRSLGLRLAQVNPLGGPRGGAGRTTKYSMIPGTWQRFVGLYQHLRASGRPQYRRQTECAQLFRLQSGP
jgi:hypothetical protein